MFSTASGVFTCVYSASCCPSFNGFVFTDVCLSYGFVSLPIFLLGVKYSPSSIFSSALIAVMNFVNAKSTFVRTIIFSKSSSSCCPGI